MSCTTLQMDPKDKRKVTIDYSLWLGSSIIASVAWIVPTGLTQANSTNTQTAAINYFESTNDEREREYEVACIITTADSVPREKTQRFLLNVEKTC